VCAGECVSSYSDGSCGDVVQWLADCELLRLQSDLDAVGAPLEEGAPYPRLAPIIATKPSVRYTPSPKMKWLWLRS